MFGGRLVRLLSNEVRAELLVAGRSLQKAASFCGTISGLARLTPVVFDRDGNVEAEMAKLGPDLVVDATGPWQSYGARPYRLAIAAIRNHAHYIDIADGREFVGGIAALDRDARRRNVAVISGASTCPALTGAVVRHLAAGFNRIHAISGGIAPSPCVPMGRSVIEAIAGYAGKPIEVWKDNQPAIEHALVSARDYTIAPPGKMPLPRMRFLLVDVPDLDVLKDQPIPVESVWFGVATRPGIYQKALQLTARCVGHGIFRSLSWLAPIMRFVTNRLSPGEHRGGMFVHVVGENDAGRIEDRSWHLVAEGDSGPNVPLLATVAVVRRMLDGDLPEPGARPAVGEFQIGHFEPLFDELGIVTGKRAPVAQSDAPLFRKLLGDAWKSIPAAVRHGHDVSGQLVLTGSGRVVRGRSLLARAIARLFRFPDSAENVPIRVSMQASRGVETWHRDFDGHRFCSTLRAGFGRLDGLVVERFGPVAIAMALQVDGRKLRYTPCHWSLLGVPLPKSLLPRGEMYECVDDGRFRFHVDVRMPVAGRLVTYKGTLQPGH